MKAAILVFALFVASAHASRFEDSQMDQSEARFIFFNNTSSATSLTLLGAVLLLGVVGFLVYSGGLLGGSAYNRNDYYQGADQQQYYDPNAYAQYR